MSRPVCVDCSREMQCTENGVLCHFTADGRPYQIRSGDEYTCPCCQAVIVTGFGSPIAEHFQGERFARLLKEATVEVTS